MSDELQQLADIPKDFVKDGMLFVNRCTKREKKKRGEKGGEMERARFTLNFALSLLIGINQDIIVHIPVNNILVGGA
ncbi:Sec61p translocation complex subunit [Ascosphaera aggregata]|nr:Sec61p translocation complex subunit [Ascosphaera aggregata]